MFSLISTIFVLVAVAFFAGFNLENRCTVNLIFYQFENAPVFLTIIISFLIGALFATIIILLFKSRINENNYKPTKTRSIFSRAENTKKSTPEKSQNSSDETIVSNNTGDFADNANEE